jgi:hypothetical protein
LYLHLSGRDVIVFAENLRISNARASFWSQDVKIRYGTAFALIGKAFLPASIDALGPSGFWWVLFFLCLGR